MSEFTAIPNFEAYRINEFGVIVGPRGKALRPWGKERPIAMLRKDGRQVAKQVSHLLLETFVGPKPFPNACALHWDDNAWNNSLENVRWGTRSENLEDFRQNTGRLPGKLRILRNVSDEDLFLGTTRAAGARFGVGHTVVVSERRRRRG